MAYVPGDREETVKRLTDMAYGWLWYSRENVGRPRKYDARAIVAALEVMAVVRQWSASAEMLEEAAALALVTYQNGGK